MDLQRLPKSGQRADPFDQLEAVVLTGGGDASYDRVNSPSSTPSAASLCLAN